MRGAHTGWTMYDLQVVAPRVRGAVKARKRRCAPVAQLDRAPGFEPVGRGFKSLRARQQKGSDDCQSVVGSRLSG